VGSRAVRAIAAKLEPRTSEAHFAVGRGGTSADETTRLLSALKGHAPTFCFDLFCFARAPARSAVQRR
jgi:hypothetical protein